MRPRTADKRRCYVLRLCNIIGSAALEHKGRLLHPPQGAQRERQEVHAEKDSETETDKQHGPRGPGACDKMASGGRETSAVGRETAARGRKSRGRWTQPNWLASTKAGGLCKAAEV